MDFALQFFFFFFFFFFFNLIVQISTFTLPASNVRHCSYLAVSVFFFFFFFFQSLPEKIGKSEKKINTRAKGQSAIKINKNHANVARW